MIANARRALRYAPPPVRVRPPERRPVEAPRPPDPPTFRGGNLEAQAITAPAWMLSGPSETGKTWATCWRLVQECMRVPGGQFALVRKVRATIAGTVFLTLRRVLDRSGADARVYGGTRPEQIVFSNGATIWIGGMDDPGKILSGERDGIYVNQAEELTLEDWETLSTRATGRGALTDTPMLFGDCNPGPGDHWIKLKEAAGALALLVTTHANNPSLYTEDGALTDQGRKTMGVLDGLTGVRRLRLRDGLWVGAEGQFFETWDPAIHVIPPRPIGADWILWGAMDYGFAHPLAFGLLALDTLGDVHLIAEHVARKTLIPDHVSAIHELLRERGLTVARLRQIVAGHDMWATRGGDDPETPADKFGKGGIRLTQATIARRPGWKAILERLADPARGRRPSLYIWESCPQTIATIPRLVHDPKDPEDVLKVDADQAGMGGDDAGDMLRYGVMAAPTRPPAPPPPGGYSFVSIG